MQFEERKKEVMADALVEEQIAQFDEFKKEAVPEILQAFRVGIIESKDEGRIKDILTNFHELGPKLGITEADTMELVHLAKLTISKMQSSVNFVDTSDTNQSHAEGATSADDQGPMLEDYGDYNFVDASDTNQSHAEGATSAMIDSRWTVVKPRQGQ